MCETGCSGLSAKDRPTSVLARDPKGLLLLKIETDGCSIRASSGCCSLPEKARVYTVMANGWVHSFADRAARIFAKGQPLTVAFGLFSRQELKLFAGVFPLSIARSLTPGTRRTGAALAGNPVAEAWCSCRRMARGLGGRRRARTPRSQKWLALEFAGRFAKSGGEFKGLKIGDAADALNPLNREY
ncbi:phosphoenolpyruvate carboxylase family protein [Striga asiatica]|uniref:Phosphoenolpyruvate carboxylase family protein n=1 Tax=Striga asiatica TaxID=4170 RepID=A0A5A7PLZ2_STRAF|nr:phosphoenolpyruvate carboxylase family protein [Striga asiatica]